jgi:hypothetical protein
MNFKQKIVVAQIGKQKELLIEGQSDISLNKFLQSDACQDLFTKSRPFRERVYTPLKTVFTFIKQVLNPDKSCRNAVAGVATEQLVLGANEISSNTGPYVKARQRLPEEMVHELVGSIRICVGKKHLILRY